MGLNPPAQLVVYAFLAGAGFFAMLSTLILMLKEREMETAHVAALFTLFTAAHRLAKLPLAPWVDRMRPRQAMVVACVTTGLGAMALTLWRNPAAMGAVLLICAGGTSTNALATKLLAAELADAEGQHLAMFGRVAAAGNLAAAVSAPCAVWLLFDAGPTALSVLIGGAYLAAACFTAMCRGVEPRGESAPRAAPTGPGLATLRAIATRQGMPGFLWVNAAGWFLYYQLFSVVPLALAENRTFALAIGPLLTINTLMVAFLQLRVSRLVDRRVRGPLSQIALACMFFGGGFLALTMGLGPVVLGAFIVLASIAEMLFVPAVDTAFVGLLGPESRARGFALLSVSTAMGESLGALLGISLYTALERAATGSYWLALAVLSVSVGWRVVRREMPSK
ncbi:MAG: MFS transporter [Pseudomonadota bacterium]|nr:MFS transporter [Pseudomonadota bacterium]